MRPSSNHRRARPLSSTIALATLLSLGTFLQTSSASPYPKDDLHEVGFGYLMERGCATYCGKDNQYCCASGEMCTTDSANIAGCTNTVAGGGYGVYTTTWTSTETFTSTVSTYYPAGTAKGICTPPAGSGQIACGSICCASWQYCAFAGQCSANGGAAGGGGGATSYYSYTTTYTSAGSTITTGYSAPYRVTSGTVVATTGTSTGTIESATSTGNGTAVGTTSGSQLSGGAIAGIVIGTIAGVILLLALCACMVVRGLWNGLLAIFGLGGKKRSRSRDRETIIVEEERYARHGGGSTTAHGRRDRHGGWFAGRPKPARSATETRRTSEKKKSGNAGLVGAGALGTLLLLLGLRRDKTRREASKRGGNARSDVSSSYFSDSYTASSPSSGSSGGRTRRSRRTETTRVSRAPSRRR